MRSSTPTLDGRLVYQQLSKVIYQQLSKVTVALIDLIPAFIYSPEGRVLNRAPQAGHTISSKLTRRILAGSIEHPHLGQRVLSEAKTLSRLIFCLWGTRRLSHFRAEKNGPLAP